MPMKNPPHPASARHDCLEPLGLSAIEAARKLGVSRKQLSDNRERPGGHFTRGYHKPRNGQSRVQPFVSLVV